MQVRVTRQNSTSPLSVAQRQWFERFQVATARAQVSK